MCYIKYMIHGQCPSYYVRKNLKRGWSFALLLYENVALGSTLRTLVSGQCDEVAEGGLQYLVPCLFHGLATDSCRYFR